MERDNGLIMKSCLLFMLTLLVPLTDFSGAHALERMTPSEMGEITAQAGISLAMDSLVVTSSSTGLSFRALDTLDAEGNAIDDGYIIGNMFSLFTADTGFLLDLGSIHGTSLLVFDGESPEIAGINLVQTFGETNFDFEYDDIRVWNYQLPVPGETHLGSLYVDNLGISHSSLKLYPPVDSSCGVRGLGEARLSIDTISFSTQEGSGDLVLSGIMKGSAFTGDPLPDDNTGTVPVDTSSWAFDEGGFKLGIPHHGDDPAGVEACENTTHPFSMDISSAQRTVAGTGEVITTPYMAVNAPMSGSIRIKNVGSRGFDFGPIAVDGIRLYKNIIEFPGRGIGH